MKISSLLLIAMLAGFLGEAIASGKTTLPALDSESLLQEDSRASTATPLRVAVGYEVVVTPRQDQFALQNNNFVWRHEFTVPEATELSLAIENFRLAPGSELRIFDPKKTVIQGPYTAADTRDHGELWTPVVPGDSIIVE
ncbi:MAG: hypothetical protein KJO35_03360, partial [Gammaproteobacteria bacterium]|nr:hypothetical protein [Gammaproteobacteria bacterium]